MGGKDKQSTAGGDLAVEPGVLEPLRAALASARESDRYRLLATLLTDLAENSHGGKPAATNQVDELTKRIQAVDSERAALDDAYKSSQADLALAQKQLDAERNRAAELQQIIDDQRSRLKESQEKLKIVEAEVAARNNDLHRAQVQVEDLELKLQRAELAGSDRSRVDALETDKRGLTEQIQALEQQMEQLRTDKDEEIDKLRGELAQASSGASQGGEGLLKGLWERLAKASPPLSEGHLEPKTQSAERLVDAFIELVRFVDDFDKTMRVFLSKYTKYHPSVKVPWEAYAKGDDLYTVVRRTVAPQGGRPVGPLKMRLRLLYAWTHAGMIGCDTAIESIGSELHAHLMGEHGAGSDPNFKVRDYIRDDGHLLFAQHIRELRSLKLAEIYGRG